MNNRITYHISEQVVMGRIRREFNAVTSFFDQSLNMTLSIVLFSGHYYPDFGDIDASFTVDGRKLSIPTKVYLVTKFAKFLVS